MQQLLKTFAKKNKTDLPAPLTFANKSFAPENVTNSEAAVFKNLGQDKAKWNGSGWVLYQKRKGATIKAQKTMAVQNNTGNAQLAAAYVRPYVAQADKLVQSWGFQKMGAIQVHKNVPYFLGRWKDGRGFIRQLPRGNRNMFNLSTKTGKLQYDAWMLSNTWNRFVAACSQWQKDNGKTQQKIAQTYQNQLKNMMPANSKMRQMLNFLRVQRYKLANAKYQTSNSTSFITRLTTAAKSQDWNSFVKLKQQFAAQLIKQTGVDSKDASARYLMASALYNSQGRIVKNVSNKYVQSSGNLEQKRRLSGEGSAAAQKSMNMNPAPFPVLKPGGWYLTKNHLQAALNQMTGQSIGMKDFHNLNPQKKFKAPQSTGMNSAMNSSSSQQIQQIFRPTGNSASQGAQEKNDAWSTIAKEVDFGTNNNNWTTFVNNSQNWQDLLLLQPDNPQVQAAIKAASRNLNSSNVGNFVTKIKQILGKMVQNQLDATYQNGKRFVKQKQTQYLERVQGGMSQ